MASKFLIGGGWQPYGYTQTYSPFIKAAGTAKKKILIIAAAAEKESETNLGEHRAVFLELGVALEELVALTVTPTEPLSLAMIEDIRPTGIFVCGGLTPSYQEALCGNQNWLQYIEREKIPYAGFSAGASIAAPAAIVGGWQINVNGRIVAMLDEELAEELDELEIRKGLGIIPFAVDVHASQWGTLSRLIHAVDQGLVCEGWAIDENTMLEVDGEIVKVHGLGQAYHVAPAVKGAVQVRICRAEDL